MMVFFKMTIQGVGKDPNLSEEDGSSHHGGHHMKEPNAKVDSAVQIRQQGSSLHFVKSEMDLALTYLP